MNIKSGKTSDFSKVDIIIVWMLVSVLGLLTQHTFPQLTIKTDL